MLNKLQPEINGELRVKLTELFKNDSKNNNKECCRKNCWAKFTYAEVEENILQF